MPRSTASRERMLAVLRQFRILLRSIREHYRGVEESSGLGGAQLWALAEVVANPGMSMGDLARQLAIHLSTASNLVSRLEEIGLVRRKRTGRDQRVVQLAATPEGRGTLRSAPRPLVGVLQQALLELPTARLDALHDELAEVIRHMKLGDARAARGVPLADLLSRPRARSSKGVGTATSSSRRGNPRAKRRASGSAGVARGRS